MSDCVYVAMDIEAGGIDEECSLLTAFFGFLDADMNLIGGLDLAVKPNDGKPYVVKAGGLAVNGINLIEHDKVAITESEAGGQLIQALKHHSKNGKVKLIPVGHNVAFDVAKVNKFLLGKKHWDMYVSYRTLDTGVMGQFLKFCGFLPPDNLGALEHLANLFKVQFKGRAHTAEADAMICADILKKMREVCLQGLSKSNV